MGYILPPRPGQGGPSHDTYYRTMIGIWLVGLFVLPPSVAVILLWAATR